MKKLMILVAMLAMVVTMAAVTAPVVGAQDKDKDKDKMADKKEDDKGKKKDEMPKTGGASINAALLGLGGATLLVGGGLLVRKVTR